MSTSTELRRIVGAMTERVRDTILLVLEDQVSTLADSAGLYAIGNPERRKRLEFIADILVSMLLASPLANHADALVALVEACEQEFAVLMSFAARNGAAYANTAKAIERVLRAFAAVHAVKIH